MNIAAVFGAVCNVKSDLKRLLAPAVSELSRVKAPSAGAGNWLKGIIIIRICVMLHLMMGD
eukprot:scaffold12162_cov32-Prasinocladus_malaysianus.AAC.1